MLQKHLSLRLNQQDSHTNAPTAKPFGKKKTMRFGDALSPIQSPARLKQGSTLNMSKQYSAQGIKERGDDLETFSQRYREKFSMDNVAVGLRVPLDRQYVQGSRKLAQVIFKTECVQKVKEYQLKKEIDLEQTKAHIVARQKKDEVRFAKEIKERDLEMTRKNYAYEEKRDKVQAQKDGIEKDKARDLRERHEKM